MIKKMDELRYTFIDEIREFYESEIEKLNELQCKIDEDENMLKINSSINSMNSKDSRVGKEDKALLEPIKITEEEEKKVASDKNIDQVHMSYKVGDSSSESEEFKEVPSPTAYAGRPTIIGETNDDGNMHFEVTSAELAKPKKVVSFDGKLSGDLADLDLDNGDVDVGIEKKEGETIKRVKSVMENYKVKKLTKERSK